MYPIIFLSLIGFAYLFWRNNRSKRKLPPVGPMRKDWKEFLKLKVKFYQKLSDSEKISFEKRVLEFLQETRIVGYGDLKITAEDLILVGTSAIIPIFNFPDWKYSFLNEVIIYPSVIKMGETGNYANGFVGSGPMEGRMVLARDALYHGYSNNTDRKNTGLHEFLHIVDKQDGVIDGIPSVLMDSIEIGPWLEMIRTKSQAIEGKDAKIRNYALTNNAEFFAVVSEYFFEHPEMMERKHPQLFQVLTNMFETK